MLPKFFDVPLDISENVLNTGLDNALATLSEHKERIHFQLTVCLKQPFQVITQIKEAISLYYGTSIFEGLTFDRLVNWLDQFSGMHLPSAEKQRLEKAAVTLHQARPLFYATSDLFKFLTTVLSPDDIMNQFIKKSFHSFSIIEIMDFINTRGVLIENYAPKQWHKFDDSFDSFLNEHFHRPPGLRSGLILKELIEGHQLPFIGLLLTKKS